MVNDGGGLLLPKGGKDDEFCSDISLLPMLNQEGPLRWHLIGGVHTHDILTAPGLMGIGYVLVGANMQPIYYP